MRKILLLVILITACSSNKKNEEIVNKLIPEVEVQKNTEFTKKVDNKIFFTVQIAALRNKNSNLENLENLIIYIEDSLIKYRLKEFSTYKEARMFRKSILNTYPDAFVQAIKNGLRIDIKQALEEEVAI